MIRLGCVSTLTKGWIIPNYLEQPDLTMPGDVFKKPPVRRPCELARDTTRRSQRLHG